MRIQSTRTYGYYVETSRFRGEDCIFSHGRVRMDYLDKLVVELLWKVRLPEAWQKDIERLVQNMDVVQ